MAGISPAVPPSARRMRLPRPHARAQVAARIILPAAPSLSPDPWRGWAASRAGTLIQSGWLCRRAGSPAAYRRS